MKWPFSRKKDVEVVPAEIQEYYQTERRERTGIAWLLALGTLLVTIFLASLLFFGGRWVYRSVVDNDEDVQQTAQNGEGSGEGSNNQGSTENQGSPTGQEGASNTGTSSTNTSTPNSSTPSESTQPPATTPTPTTPAPTSSSTQGAATTPVTGDDLPNTGPGDVVGLFIVTVAVASLGHYALTTRRNQ